MAEHRRAREVVGEKGHIDLSPLRRSAENRRSRKIGVCLNLAEILKGSPVASFRTSSAERRTGQRIPSLYADGVERLDCHI
jgi:hypothetical protein